MQKISRDTIQKVLDIDAAPKVTMYIPLEATASPPHITENQIRLKNLINKAAGSLESMPNSSVLSKELQTFLEEHIEDLEFWKAQSRGVLLCAAPGIIELYQLPIDTEEYVVVDDTFHIAPVLALLQDAREYYVLSLAQQNPKLFEGDMYGLRPSTIMLPETMRIALGIDEPNQQSENQGSATGSSLNTGWFNGRGGARDPQDVDRLRYFHLIDKLIVTKADRSKPLILSGIDAETAEFRDLSKYPQILSKSVAGNQSDTRLDELFAKVQPIVHEELIAPEHAAALEEYERLSGANPDRVAHDTKSITAAAEQGRIDKLLAMMARHTTDTVQDKVESVLRITFPDAERSKTLNNLAMRVWQMSGKVFSLLPHEMPNGAPMVARLRY